MQTEMEICHSYWSLCKNLPRNVAVWNKKCSLPHSFSGQDLGVALPGAWRLTVSPKTAVKALATVKAGSYWGSLADDQLHQAWGWNGVQQHSPLTRGCRGREHRREHPGWGRGLRVTWSPLLIHPTAFVMFYPWDVSQSSPQRTERLAQSSIPEDGGPWWPSQSLGGCPPHSTRPATAAWNTQALQDSYVKPGARY